MTLASLHFTDKKDNLRTITHKKKRNCYNKTQIGGHGIGIEV